MHGCDRRRLRHRHPWYNDVASRLVAARLHHWDLGLRQRITRIYSSGHSVAVFVTVDRSQVSFDDFDVSVFKIVHFSPSISI